MRPSTDCTQCSTFVCPDKFWSGSTQTATRWEAADPAAAPTENVQQIHHRPPAARSRSRSVLAALRVFLGCMPNRYSRRLPNCMDKVRLPSAVFSMLGSFGFGAGVIDTLQEISSMFPDIDAPPLLGNGGLIPLLLPSRFVVKVPS